MKSKFLRSLTALVVIAGVLVFGAEVSMAQYGSAPKSVPQLPQGPSGTQTPEKENGGKPPKINKAEEEGYKAVYESRDAAPETQIPLAEEFLKKFPQSHYLPGVYSQLTSAYAAAGQEDKMFEYGSKALELNPDNIDVLVLLAMAIPRRIRSTTPDAAQQLQKAEAYAHHAIELIPLLTKPDSMDDAVFEKAKNDKLSLAHSGLGLIDFQHSKFEDARTELNQAVQLASSPDPVDYYLLGNADVKASYLNGAIAAYEKCAASGPLTAQCKARADATKKDLGTVLSKD